MSHFLFYEPPYPIYNSVYSARKGAVEKDGARDGEYLCADTKDKALGFTVYGRRDH